MVVVLAEPGSRRGRERGVYYGLSVDAEPESVQRPREARSILVFIPAKIFTSREAKNRENEPSMDQLPSIPGATLTGMRHFIRGNRNSKLMASKVGNDDYTTRSKDDWLEAQHCIKVIY